MKCFQPTVGALGSDLFGRLKDLTSDGGPLGAVRCGFLTVAGYPFQWAPWFADRTKCFPPAEWASHVFDTFIALTNARPASVRAFSGRYFRDFDQDDVMTLAVDFEEGHYFQMNIAWTMKPEWGYHKQDFQLVCDRGLILHNWWSAEWRTSESRGEYASTRAKTGGDRWDHYHDLIDGIEGGTPVSPNEHKG